LQGRSRDVRPRVQGEAKEWVSTVFRSSFRVYWLSFARASGIHASPFSCVSQEHWAERVRSETNRGHWAVHVSLQRDCCKSHRCFSLSKTHKGYRQF
jgi:hypothetical protein